MEQYHKGYMHAIDYVRKIKLRSRDASINKGRLNPNQSSSSQINTETRNEKQKEPVVHKEIENRIEKIKEPKQTTPMDVDKISSMFNLQSELAKLNNSVPFNELLRNQEYRDTITKMVKNQGEAQPDILEVTDDNPTIVLGSKIDNVDNEEIPPFYMSLNVHDMVLHNAMFFFRHKRL